MKKEIIEMGEVQAQENSGRSAPMSVSATQVGNTANIPKLDGKNFQSWQEMVTMVLKLRGLGDALVQGVDEMVDMQARLVLLETMDESHRVQVRGLGTAKLVMERLKQVYADTSASNVYRMLYNYFRYNKDPKDSISEHVGKMANLRGELADLGQKQSEELYQVTLIASLPQEYRNILEVWEMSHPDMRTSANLISRLLKREADLKSVNSAEFGFVVSGNRNSQWNQLSFAERKKKMRCHNCGELGHLARECNRPPKTTTANGSSPKRGDGSTPASNTRANMANSEPNDGATVAQQAPTTSTTEQLSKSQWAGVVSSSAFMVGGQHEWMTEWLLDSGASSHMCRCEDWFSEIQYFDKPIQCFIGDGSTMDIIGFGSIQVIGLVDGQATQGRLDNVMLVPKLATNLFSVGAAAEKGLKTVFSGQHCKLIHGNKVIAEADKRNDDGLYLLKIKAIPSSMRALKVGHPKSVGDWHRALGHASLERVRALLKDLGQEWKEEDFACPDCPAGKGRRVSHPTVGVKAETPGCIHVDLSGGPNKASLQGFKYYLLCKDELTDFTLVYFCKSKAEVPLRLAEMVRDFESNSGYKVHSIHSDNGSEFVNEPVRLLFMKNNIIHQTSAPYCPQQNGRIEREMYTVTASARTILIASRLPIELWPEAIEVATHVKNRLPNKQNKKSPFERLLNRKPNIDYLRKFGEEVHVIVNDQYLTKWDARTIEGHIVGYTEKSNTYRVYLPSKMRVIKTCDIIVRPHKEGSESSKASALDRVVCVDLSKGQETGNENEKPNNFTTSARPIEEKSVNESPVDTSDQTWRFSTPNQTPSLTRAPKPLVTGSALEEFFTQYWNQNQSDEIGTPQTGEERSPTPPPRLSSLEGSHSDSTRTIRLDPEARPPYLPDKSHLLEPALTTEMGEHIEEMPPLIEPSTLSEGAVVTDRCQPEHGVAHHDPHALYVSNLCLKDSDMLEELPKTYAQAMRRHDSGKWLRAIQVELDAHKENQTWVVVPKPAGERRYSSRWVFTIKRDAAGNVERYKARLVARGFEQVYGLDFADTFAPVAKIESIRTLIAVSAARRYKICQFDVSTAFLHGKLRETVYIDPPDGVEISNNECLKLSKALYGLRQAPRAWNSTFNQALVDLGFSPTQSDQCVYKHLEEELFIVIYVDDGLILGKSQEECESVLSELEKIFKIKKLSGACFVGLQMLVAEGSIRLGQRHYIRDVVERFGLKDAKGVSSPIVDMASLFTDDDSPPTTAPYRQAVGCLQYLASRTRPDVMVAANVLARFNNEPKDKHWVAVKRVIKYLKETADLEIKYEGPCDQITGYSDADYGNDLETRKSTSGLIINLGSGPIVFASRRQTDIAQSSTEAEYIAANEAVKELFWVKQFLDEIKVLYQKPRLLVDNQSTIAQIKNVDTRRRSKHVDIKYHYIRSKLQEGLFDLQHVESGKQVADMLTKAINGPTIRKLSTIGNIFNEPTNTSIKTSKSMACVTKLPRWTYLLTMLCAFMIVAPCTALKFVRVSPITFADTTHQIKLGTKYVEINYKPVAPCDIINTEWAEGIKSTTYRSLKSNCYRTFNETLVPVLDALARVKTQSKIKGGKTKRFAIPTSTKSPLVRRKRIAPVIIAASAVVGLVGLAGGGQLAYSYLDEDSSYNRLNRVEEREKIREKEINELHIQLEKAKEVRAQQIEIAEKTARDLHHLAELVPTIAATTYEMIDSIKTEAASMRKIIRHAEKEQLATEEFAELFRLEEIRHLKPEDTYLDGIRRRESGTFVLDAYYPIYSKELRIQKVKAFRHYENITTKPVLMEYFGPEHVLVNMTNGCKVGIGDPTTLTTTQSCTQDDGVDPRLAMSWRTVSDDHPEYEKLTAPQVIKTATENAIYCLFHTIDMQNQTLDCPPFAFVLPTDVPYTLTNQGHKVEVDFYQASGSKVHYFYPTYEKDEFNPEYIRLLNANKKANDESLQTGRFDFKANTISIPLGYEVYGGLVASILVLICAAMGAGRYCCQGRGAQQGEHINIINSIPPGFGNSQQATNRPPETTHIRLYDHLPPLPRDSNHGFFSRHGSPNPLAHGKMIYDSPPT